MKWKAEATPSAPSCGLRGPCKPSWAGPNRDGLWDLLAAPRSGPGAARLIDERSPGLGRQTMGGCSSSSHLLDRVPARVRPPPLPPPRGDDHARTAAVAGVPVSFFWAFCFGMAVRRGRDCARGGSRSARRSPSLASSARPARVRVLLAADPVLNGPRWAAPSPPGPSPLTPAYASPGRLDSPTALLAGVPVRSPPAVTWPPSTCGRGGAARQRARGLFTSRAQVAPSAGALVAGGDCYECGTRIRRYMPAYGRAGAGGRGRSLRPGGSP